MKSDDSKVKTIEKKVTFPYLKKGDGKLASDFYKSTKFAEQRKRKIIEEQIEREKKGV